MTNEIAHPCRHGNESVLCIPCYVAEIERLNKKCGALAFLLYGPSTYRPLNPLEEEIKRLRGLMRGLEDHIRRLQHERDEESTHEPGVIDDGATPVRASTAEVVLPKTAESTASPVHPECICKSCPVHGIPRYMDTLKSGVSE